MPRGSTSTVATRSTEARNEPRAPQCETRRQGRLRLLIVNHEYPPIGGGGSNASRFLATTLTQQGHQVSVVTSAFGEYRGLSVEDGVRVHRIPALRRKIDRSDMAEMTCFAGSGLARAPGIARAERVEGVLAFFTLPSGLVGYWLKAHCKLPYVVSLRGADVPGLDPEVERTHRRIRWLRQKILHSARAIVANSSNLAELSARTDPFDVAVIPNGVDSDLFRPHAAATSSESETPFRILFAGRLREQKNLTLLLDELARLRREGVTAFRLDVAGDGPLGPAMHKRAEHLGLSENIVWHGWVTKPELGALYQTADCFVNPSLYEGLPNTVLEAMASGLPVIASRVAGNDTLVASRETGLLFDLEEPRQLGDALTTLLADRAAARQMGARGRARVVERFSWQVVADAYLRLLDVPPLPERPGR